MAVSPSICSASNVHQQIDAMALHCKSYQNLGGLTLSWKRLKWNKMKFRIWHRKINKESQEKWIFLWRCSFDHLRSLSFAFGSPTVVDSLRLCTWQQEEVSRDFVFIWNLCVWREVNKFEMVYPRCFRLYLTPHGPYACWMLMVCTALASSTQSNTYVGVGRTKASSKLVPGPFPNRSVLFASPRELIFFNQHIFCKRRTIHNCSQLDYITHVNAQFIAVNVKFSHRNMPETSGLCQVLHISH